MSQTVTDCSAGTWYSFNNTNLNIGQTVQVQFGAFDEGKTALNIYLTRPGGSLVQSLVPTNDVQTFQFGIFNASVPLSQNGIALSGFLAWSPDFQVWNNVTTTTSAAPTTSTTSITSTTATAAPSATTTPASNNNSSGGLSSGAKAGIGIGAALGGVLLAVLIVGAWLWNRRKQRGAAAGQPDAPPMESFTKPPGPESDATGQGFAANTQNQGLHELPPAVNSQTDEKGYYQSVPQQPAVHEMPSNHQAYEMA
uniref:Paired immunoglobulin-like type 2 receptor alpha n=1 Tax=Talaromyces marneffei PM1 TaxID=1077442 RepID=A0A093UW74_TALMA